MRGGTNKLPFKVGDVLMVKEETGTNKGEFFGEHIITHVRPHAKSYFCKDLETGRTYLRSLDQMKINPEYVKPDIEVKKVKLINNKVTAPLKGILRKPNSRKVSFAKNVCFDATFHTARIVAKQSIKEWKQSKV